MRLAHRMVNNFCLSVGTSNNTRSTVVSGLDEFGIRVTSHKSRHEPNGMVLCAATSFWLPISPQNVFNFLKDERTRPQVLHRFNISIETSFIWCLKLIIQVTFSLFFLCFGFIVGRSFKWKLCSRSCSYHKRIKSWKLHIGSSCKLPHSKLYRFLDS